MSLKNDLLLRAARGEETERIPVWLMRQAGRVLPEYREVRKRAGGFKMMIETPELATEVTLQPVHILGVDAAIIFSDILVVPEAMGLPYEVVESRGPWFEKTIEDEKDIRQLKVAESGDLAFVMDAIRMTKKELNGAVPLIGFAGAPWTLLAYMIEGHGSKTFSKAKKFLYTQPLLAHRLLDKITQSTIHYLRGQAEAGADLLQLFDSWAGILSPAQYKEFSLPYIDRICKELATLYPSIPKTVFAKGAPSALTEFKNISCEVIGLDWTMEISESRLLTGAKTLQGNLDPCLLYADFATIRKETTKMLTEFGPHRYIANLGHGLYPDTEKDKVRYFVDTVKSFRFSIRETAESPAVKY